jgi:predicted ATPase
MASIPAPDQSRPAADEMPRAMLPPAPTPLLGRERELAAIAQRLNAGVRLITLTGPPGIGKSRLALEVAERAARMLDRGAVWVDLAPTGEPGRVMAVVAQALSIGETPDRQPPDRVADALKDQPFLLILDNFEHLLDASPRVGELLARCPALVVIATSRIPLHLAWEHEFPVPALALPDPARPAVDVLSSCPSVALFLERARAVAPDFELTDANARTVAEICVRLDGLPLAIELAAPRVKLLPPQGLLERLEHRLDFLRRVGRDLPARHQTLRAAIGWSYTLLRPHEQGLLRRLAVFVGGFSLVAAESVCWSADQPGEAIEALDALVDASLVFRDPAADEPRYRMLETIREFAAEQLAAAGEPARTQRHHAAFFLAMAEHAAVRMHGPEEDTWLRRLDRDHDNFRAVLRWMLAEGQARAALRLAVALWWFWYVRGHVREGRGWLEDVNRAAGIPFVRVVEALDLTP